jgi:hypothetical protein
MLAKGRAPALCCSFHATIRRLVVPPEFATALRCFREAYRHPLVPLKFVVPVEHEWPIECHGLRLGAQAAEYRKQYRKHGMTGADMSVCSDMMDLSELEFAFDNSDWKWERRIKSAIITYKELHGNLRVLQSFVIPSSAPWAEEAWGVRFGSIIHKIRSHGVYLSEDKPERREWLDEMGFVWERKADEMDFAWDLTRNTLTMYKEVHCDLAVPAAFVVPSSAPWPTRMWGVKLGETVHAIRLKRKFLSDDTPRSVEWEEREEWLDLLGFVWDAHHRSWEQTQRALATYKVRRLQV